MAQTVKLKRSAVSGNVPTTSDLALGEIAINTYDGNIFIKKNDGSESIVTFSAGGNAGSIEEDSFTGNGNTTAFTISTAPSTEENLLVFIDAAFQNRDSFTVSGTTVTFDTAPDNGSSVRIYHVIPGSVDDGILTVAKFAASAIVTEAEGISSNDNDTTLPTSAAVKDYVDTQVATVDTLPEVLANGNTTGGTDIAVSAADDITFTDSSKAIFGAGSDLQIYHDGSHSYIKENGTGNLFIDATSLRLRTGAGTENYLVAEGNGAVTLYYDNTSVLSTTADGISVTSEVEANEFIGDLRGAVLFKAQAGEALSKGDVVYISGINGNTTIVSKADADDVNKMPAFGVAATAITSGTTGDIYTFGTLSGLNTSAFTLGDELYVSTTAGALTNSAPTGSSAQIQKIAKVTRVDNSAGSIKIMGAGRSNATPNLDDGDIFIGNASNQAVTASLDTKIESYLDGGTSTPTFSTLAAGNTTLTGYLRGPSSFTIDPATHGDDTGTVVIAGNLQVDGTTTTINSTTLTVDDKLITLASGSINAAAADGAGIEVDITGSTNPSITYDGTNDEWDFNKNINITGSVTTSQSISINNSQIGTIQQAHGIASGNTIANKFQVGRWNGSTFDRWMLVPVDDGTAQYSKELGYDFGTGAWFFDDKLGIGTASPDGKVHIESSSSGATAAAGGDELVLESSATTGLSILSGTANDGNILFGDSGNSAIGYVQYKHADNALNFGVNGGTKATIDSSGNVGIGTTPATKLQVEEYGIDTTETSTTATTQVAIHTFAAATFRSARFTIQVTNSTDSTYHLTEILMIHDGTTPSITEYGTIFTGAAAEATFDADINTGNVRLLATPASTDTMEFKVVSHSITT